jgi:hypothetical protein
MARLELSQVGQLFRAKGDNQLAWQGFMIDKTTINGPNTQIYGHPCQITHRYLSDGTSFSSIGYRMAIWHLSQDWVSCGPTNKSGVLSGHCSGLNLRAEVALFQIGGHILDGLVETFPTMCPASILTLSHRATFLG